MKSADPESRGELTKESAILAMSSKRHLRVKEWTPSKLLSAPGVTQTAKNKLRAKNLLHSFCVLLLMIGFPMLFLGSIVYCGLLFWDTTKLSTRRKGENGVVGICGLVGGALLASVFGVVARSLHAVIPVSSLEISLCATPVIFAVLTFALTRTGVALIDAFSVT